MSTLSASAAVAGGPADTLITNGRIATMGKRAPFVSALAIKGDRIIAVGPEGDLLRLRWPFRQHVTWDSSAQRILGVLEKVHREVPLTGLRWGLDHCEVMGAKTLERIAKLGGSINIQNRLSTDGEAFLMRQGAAVAADAPPIARIREMGIPLSAGTDANRAVSYNPWVGVHWLITGKTLGGAKLNADRNLLDRAEALRMYTAAGAWISGEEERKGTLEAGKLADIVFLSADYFSIPVDSIKDIESVMTMVGGKVVYGAGAYERLAPPAPPINQDWLPIKTYGGYQKRAGAARDGRDGTRASAQHRGCGHLEPRLPLRRVLREDGSAHRSGGIGRGEEGCERVSRVADREILTRYRRLRRESEPQRGRRAA